MTTKIALCQLSLEAGKPKRNLSLLEKIIKQNSKKGVKLFIFPEDFLYGIIREKNNIEEAGRKFKFWIKTFSVIAKRYSVDLIPGSFPLYIKGSVFNTAVYIDSSGKIINKYCKTNLWLSERKDYHPSIYPLQSFKSILGKTVVIICWDLIDHKLFEEAVKQNAEWVIIISLWSTNQSRDLAEERGNPKKYKRNEDSPLIDALIKSRVYEYGLGIIFCNFAKTIKYASRDGTFDSALSAGHSQILTPLSKISEKITNRKEKILICDMPDIKDLIRDQEIFYGRREDVLKSYS